MDRQFETALSSHDERSIAVREQGLASEVMDELDFAAASYSLWTGDELADLSSPAALSAGRSAVTSKSSSPSR
jgi:hypothetical protein